MYFRSYARFLVKEIRPNRRWKKYYLKDLVNFEDSFFKEPNLYFFYNDSKKFKRKNYFVETILF